MNTGSVIEVTQRWQAARSLLGTSPLRLSQLRAALLLVALAGTTVLVMYLAAREAGNWLLQEEAAQLRPHLSLYASALEGQIEHYRALPAVLALDPDLHTALTGGLDSERRKRLNLKLESVNGAATTSTLTLLDGGGHCIAASNWSLPQSNVGHDYSFRPYFRQLANHDDGSFYGVGHTTGIPGYFLSKALRETSGKLIGALVIKLDLRDVERQWLRSTHTVLVTDPNGVVFLASNPAWRYRVLTALTASQRSELEATQQFASQALRPVHGRVIENLGDDGRRVQFDEPGIAGDYLWQSLPLAREGWTLHALDNMRSGTAVARIAELAAAGIWLSLVFFALFLRQRMRTSRLRQRSREELEELVRQHTAALRTAQDGLVQAANLANLGHAESLEHLPQGVSVVDAELRLTAWNHRYVELFRLPSDLMRAGRPIEDILRHNARRGLMGTGDVEDAVRRRICARDIPTGSNGSGLTERCWKSAVIPCRAAALSPAMQTSPHTRAPPAICERWLLPSSFEWSNVPRSCRKPSAMPSERIGQRRGSSPPPSTTSNNRCMRRDCTCPRF
jgi:histidine kinase